MDSNGLLSSGAEAFQAYSLSDAQVKTLSDQACKEMDAKAKIAPANSEYSQRLNKIAAALGDNINGQPVNYKVYETKDVNAFAMANGCIRVYSGLMDLMNDNEVEAVIGHEMGHVALGHVKKGMQVALGTNAVRAAAASAGGTVEVTGVDYRHLSTVSAVLREAGCDVQSGAESIRLRRDGPLQGVRPVRTAPYPGFPTDAQAPLMAALTRGKGCTVFVENIFESRYRHVDELSRMGADIRVQGRTAAVTGVGGLHGAAVQGGDRRGAAALVVAGVAARGETRVTGLAHIRRGYDGLDIGLRALGADITETD